MTPAIVIDLPDSYHLWQIPRTEKRLALVADSHDNDDSYNKTRVKKG
jgi:hypothetical protein